MKIRLLAKGHHQTTKRIGSKHGAPRLIHLGQITSEFSNSPQHGCGRSQDHYTVNKGKNLKYLRAKTYDHRMINTHV